MYIIYYISMQIAYYHYFHIIIISRTNWWNCLIFCSWYKFMKKSWLKNFWVGMKKWLWLLCSRYPRLSPEWIDGINDFFACWHKFRKIESYVNDFLVSIVKKWAWLLIHETLKYAISQEWIDESSRCFCMLVDTAIFWRDNRTLNSLIFNCRWFIADAVVFFSFWLQSVA